MFTTISFLWFPCASRTSSRAATGFPIITEVQSSNLHSILQNTDSGVLEATVRHSLNHISFDLIEIKLVSFFPNYTPL